MNLTDLYDAILNGKLDRAVAVTNEAISEGVLPNEIITNYMIKAMEEIGNRFESVKVFVHYLLMSSRAMKGALDLLIPLLQGETDVASMFEGCGFEVVNLGVDVSSEKFVEAARTNNADIICMSALLTTTMNYMKVVVDDLKTAGLYGKVKVMVGGAPINEAFAHSIGADAYTSNANAAVIMAKKLIGAA